LHLKTNENSRRQSQQLPPLANSANREEKNEKRMRFKNLTKREYQTI
jgi:hypothetical protein